MSLVVTLPIRVAMGWGTNAHPTFEGPETGSSTFKKGELLIYSSGLITGASADPTALIGVALKDANNAAASSSNTSQYVPAIPSLVFEGQIDTPSTGGLALLQSFVGLQYGIEPNASTGLWFIDQSDTTNKIVTVVGLKDPVGTVGGRVYFVFNYVKTAWYST